ncbi:sodium-dependent glucose transporter 1-like protein [Leptotrombidium deliense]|uniref:Sodium-dependent glucose transporter 1-like protein n=1 Tax=Leptotrombidium deliense TaxID=299467 RepID=A0A443SA85_9ACAR|nr:sodium-dependent glucose transporter 1-like protein [Leptotrombidium deliense]
MFSSVLLKRLTTIIIILSIFLHQLSYYSFNLTLLDFKEIIHRSLKETTIAQTVRNFANVIGSLLVGSVFSKYGNSQLICAAFVAVEGIATAILPNVSNLFIYIAINAIPGMCCGVIETISYINIVALWKEKSAPFIQALAFTSSVGSVLTPLIFNPFLSNVESEEHSEDCIPVNNKSIEFANVTVNPKPFGDLHISEIWIPHLVIGIFMVINGILCAILELKRIRVEETIEVKEENERKEEKVSLKQKDEQKISKHKVPLQQSKYYRITFVVIMCILITIYWGFASSFFQFWITFVMFLNVNISKSRAVLMLSAFSFSNVFGNFIAMLVAIKVKSMPMLLSLNILLLTSCVICIIGANGSELMLWIGAYNLLEEKVGVTNFIGSVFATSSVSLNAIGLPIIIANFIECYPTIFLHYTTISVTVVFVLLIVFYGKEDVKQETLQEDDEIKALPQEIYMRKYSVRRVSVAVALKNLNATVLTACKKKIEILFRE